MTARRSWAALLTLVGALALAAASASEQQPSGARAPDAGVSSRARDAGPPFFLTALDAGRAAQALSLEDREVLENLELLEHLPESDVLELLLPLRDE